VARGRTWREQGGGVGGKGGNGIRSTTIGDRSTTKKKKKKEGKGLLRVNRVQGGIKKKKGSGQEELKKGYIYCWRKIRVFLKGGQG